MASSPHHAPYPAELQPPPISLSNTHIELLITTYNDVFSSLRTNSHALAWILSAAFETGYVADDSRPNIELSRGYSFLFVCARASCASHMPETILQRTNTLLLPTTSRGQNVFGFFFDHVQNTSSPPTTHVGRYTYSSAPGELFKCARVEGTTPSNPTVTISRLILVNRSIFLLDTVVVSFRYPTLTAVPEDILLYSRHFSFHKLATPLSHSAVGDGSFHGLAAFGAYDSLPLPWRIPPGMRQVDSPHAVRTVPDHTSICHTPRSMLVGIRQDLLQRLRASYLRLVAADVHLSLPMRTMDTFVPPRTDTAAHRRTVSAQHHQPTPYVSQPSQPNQLAQQFSFPTQLMPGADDQINQSESTTRPYVDCRMDVSRVPSEIPNSSTRLNAPQRLLPNNAMHDGTTFPGRDMAPNIAHVNPQLMPNTDADLSSTVTVRESGHRARQSSQRILLGSGTDVTPTVHVNEVVAGMPRMSSRVLPANSANTSSSIIFNEATGNTATIVNKPPSEQPVLPFKKTLPAPTKSEIVIRNRISAQRSNEKRRRRIENTKMELRFLKAILPTLEQRKGCLVEENQSLRLRFIQRYREADIESFF
eukprot:TRINITY_DN52_c0_g1_i1.p1 TRINITY_DN52_c0_g1~~TRINITY_DN52_c0_g1_i1.p1  ORF type:complete len:659 (+),score=63.48 TRINITY_DN52_c0_g1_i1:205-1977(+)